MRVPFLLWIVCLTATLGLFLGSGHVISDIVLLGMLATAAALILLVRAALAPTAKAEARPIVVDGSNVMHWRDETPQLATLQEVVSALKSQGYQPGVIFDANAGYKMTGRYLDDKPLAKMLGLPVDRVLVVSKGQPADPVILDAARDLGATILTNDKYRDWADTYPEVTTPGHLRRGGYRNGALWLDTDAPVPAGR